MANYFQAVDLVFGANKQEVEKAEAGNVGSSLLAKLVLQDSACWQSMSALFNPSELETLFKELYCQEIWHQLSADNISCQTLAQCLFNNALINDAPEVIHALQVCLGIKATGIMDQDTLACLQETSALQLIKQVEQVLLYAQPMPVQHELASQPVSWN